MAEEPFCCVRSQIVMSEARSVREGAQVALPHGRASDATALLAGSGVASSVFSRRTLLVKNARKYPYIENIADITTTQSKARPAV